MSLRLNNSKDITCDKLWLLDANNNLQDVLTLINNAGVVVLVWFNLLSFH